mgnify:CR=1 FL=1
MPVSADRGTNCRQIKLNEQEYQRKAFIQKQIGENAYNSNSRMNEIATEANKGRNEASLKLNELEYSLRT